MPSTASTKPHQLETMSPTTREKAQCEHLETVTSIDAHAFFDKDKDLTLWQATKTFPWIALFTLAACSSGMLFGYDQVVNGASISMPGFLLYFGAMTPEHQPYLPSIWTSLWTAMSALMQAVGGIAIAPVSDRLGRRYSIMGVCVVSAGGVAVQYCSYTRGMLLAGKMINGFAIGGALSVGTTWASEISPVRLRGPIQSSIVLATVFMQAMGLLVIRQNITDITTTGFRIVFAVQWPFAALTFVLFALVPESPTWLILQNRPEEAKRAVTRLYGKNNDPEARFQQILQQIQVEAAVEHASGIGGFLELYRGDRLKRTITVHLMFFGAGLAGASFLAQSIYFLILAGLPAVNTFDVSIGGFALALFTIVL